MSGSSRLEQARRHRALAVRGSAGGCSKKHRPRRSAAARLATAGRTRRRSRPSSSRASRFARRRAASTDSNSLARTVSERASSPRSSPARFTESSSPALSASRASPKTEVRPTRDGKTSAAVGVQSPLARERALLRASSASRAPRGPAGPPPPTRRWRRRRGAIPPIRRSFVRGDHGGRVATPRRRGVADPTGAAEVARGAMSSHGRRAAAAPPTARSRRR